MDGLQSWSASGDFSLAQPPAESHQQRSLPTEDNGDIVIESVSTNADGSYAVSTMVNGRMESTELFDANDVSVSSTTFGYDAHGRQETVTDSRTGTTTYAYNNGDQVVQVTAPAPESSGSPLITEMEYDAMGRLVTRTLPDSSQTHMEYFETGRLKKEYGSQTYTVEYTYDSQGRMKTLTTEGAAGPAVTTWNYDPLRGWLTSKVYHDGKGTSYTYTLGGRLATRTWARDIPGSSGNPIVTAYAYDAAGALLSTDYPAGTATHDILITYDRLGRVTKTEEGVLDGEGGITAELTFDYTHRGVEGAVLTETRDSTDNALDRVLTRTYEDGTGGTVNGRSSGFTLGTSGDPDADHAQVHSYDDLGRLHTISSGAFTATYAYVPGSAGLVESVTRQWGSSPAVVSTNTYQPGRDSLAEWSTPWAAPRPAPMST